MKEQIIDLISKISDSCFDETPKSRLKKVISGYKEILLQNPDRSQFEEWELWWNLGCILDELGQSQEALIAYQEVIHLNPSCEPVYEKAIAIQPDNYKLWWQLACNIYAKKGEKLEAKEAYLSVIRINPNFLPGYHSLLELELDNWEIWWEFAKALDRQNQYDQAVVAYHHAIVFHPDFDEGFYNYPNDLDLQLVSNPVDYSEANIINTVDLLKSELKNTYVKIAQKATDSNVHHQLIKTWQRQGNFNKVITLLKNLVKKEPNNVGLYIEMGNTFLSLDRRDEALKSYYLADHIQLEENRRNGNIGKLLLITLPKSGGQYLASSLQHGLGIKKNPLPGSNNISFDNNVFVMAVHEKFNPLENVIIVSHAYANDFNRIAITHYTDKLIVNIRDPRQATLSHIHNINLIHRQAGKEQLLLCLQLPQNYFLWSLTKQITWQIEEGFLPNAINFIQGWLETYEDKSFYPEILFARYEDLVEYPDKYFNEILDFYGIKKTRFKFPVKPKFKENTHNRKGEIDEWKSVFTPEQAEKACSMIPEKIYKFFNWSEK